MAGMWGDSCSFFGQTGRPFSQQSAPCVEIAGAEVMRRGVAHFTYASDAFRPAAAPPPLRAGGGKVSPSSDGATVDRKAQRGETKA